MVYDPKQTYGAPTAAPTTSAPSFSDTPIAVTSGSPGRRIDPVDREGGARIYEGRVLPETKTVGGLIADLYNMSPDELRNLKSKMTLAGYGKLDSSSLVDDATVQAYTNLLRDTSAYQNFDDTRDLGTGFTPSSFLDAKVAESNGTDATRGENALSDPFAARQLVTRSLQAHLGRSASEAEVKAFTSALRGYESNNVNADRGAFADQYATSTPGLANEAGAQSEVGFVNVLSSMLGVR